MVKKQLFCTGDIFWPYLRDFSSVGGKKSGRILRVAVFQWPQLRGINYKDKEGKKSGANFLAVSCGWP